jgi:hypothetical protein
MSLGVKACWLYEGEIERARAWATSILARLRHNVS